MSVPPHRAAAICVPIRNEAALLPLFLDAIAAQPDVRGTALCLFLDGCSDDSATIVARRAAGFPMPIEVETGPAGGAPNTGSARRRALAIGARRLAGVPHAALISTDADSAPAGDWLAANLAALELADVVAGRISRAADLPNLLQDRIERYFDALFALRRAIDPVPWEAKATHHYTSGASLAFRIEAYREIGGFAPVPAAEDGLIVDAAHRAGLRVRRDGRVRVQTSSRREGRARAGLAEHLRRLDDGNVRLPTVAHPADAAWRYRGQAAARAAWGLPGAYPRLARTIGCDPAHIDRVVALSRNAEAFATQVVPEPPGGERMIPLDQAEPALAVLAAGRACQAA